MTTSPAVAVTGRANRASHSRGSVGSGARRAVPRSSCTGRPRAVAAPSRSASRRRDTAARTARTARRRAAPPGPRWPRPAANRRGPRPDRYPPHPLDGAEHPTDDLLRHQPLQHGEGGDVDHGVADHDQAGQGQPDGRRRGDHGESGAHVEEGDGEQAAEAVAPDEAQGSDRAEDASHPEHRRQQAHAAVAEVKQVDGDDDDGDGGAAAEGLGQVEADDEARRCLPAKGAETGRAGPRRRTGLSPRRGRGRWGTVRATRAARPSRTAQARIVAPGADHGEEDAGQGGAGEGAQVLDGGGGDVGRRQGIGFLGQLEQQGRLAGHHRL